MKILRSLFFSHLQKKKTLYTINLKNAPLPLIQEEKLLTPEEGDKEDRVEETSQKCIPKRKLFQRKWLSIFATHKSQSRETAS